MSDNGPEDGRKPSGEIEVELSRQAVELLIALNAAMVNIHMYPPTSDMIATSVEAGYERISRILQAHGKLSLGEANNLLLVNGVKLDEKDQARAPVVAFLTSLRRRDVFSITISSGLSSGEFRQFLEVMAQEPEKLHAQGGLTEALKSRQVDHILVNERRYISVSEDEEMAVQAKEAKEEEEGKKEAEEALARLREEEIQRLTEKLKDERFIGFVLGKEDRERLGEEALADIMGNPPRMGILLRQAIREIVAEIEEPERALQAVLEGLNRTAGVVSELDQSELREMDSAELCKAVGFLEPSELKEYLLAELPPELAGLDLRRQVLDSLRENKVLDLLENVIREHDSLKVAAQQREQDPALEQRFQALSSLIDELYTSSVGKAWEAAVSDRIFQADMWKKISESREAGGEAGASTLVYQISSFLVSEGLGLDIDELARGMTIDESIPRLIEKLYRTSRPEAAEKLIRNLLDNLNDMSPEIRLKTAQTLQRLPEIIQAGEALQEAAVAHELKSQLLGRLEKERELNEIYEALAASLASLAERFILSRDYRDSIDIIDTFWKHRSPSEMRKPEQQKIAEKAIASIATPELLDSLVEVLREGDIESITEVANILIKFENKSVQPLIQVLKESDDILVRKVTFDALEYIGKDAIKSLINDLERYDPWHMYRNIISILAEIGNRSIIQSISRFINHANPEVRRETVKALGRIRTSESVSLLVEGLKDRDDQVVRECCLALGRIGDISTSPALLEIIKPPRSMRYKRSYPPFVQAAAVWALGQVGDYSSVPAIARILKRRYWFPVRRARYSELRQEAARALAGIGSPECGETLTRCLSDRDEKVSRACQEGLRALQIRLGARPTNQVL
jgi:HEAT repeat protein